MALVPKLLGLSSRCGTSLPQQYLTRHFRLSVAPLLKSEKMLEVVNPGFQRMKNNQKKYQVENGLPIHLKLGSKDKMLYQLSLLMVFGGLAGGVYTLVKCVLKRS